MDHLLSKELIHYTASSYIFIVFRTMGNE